jgi:hypothetical protein
MEVCQCGHRWEQHTYLPSGAQPCKSFGCGCSDYEVMEYGPVALPCPMCGGEKPVNADYCERCTIEAEGN